MGRSQRRAHVLAFRLSSMTCGVLTTFSVFSPQTNGICWPPKCQNRRENICETKNGYRFWTHAMFLSGSLKIRSRLDRKLGEICGLSGSSSRKNSITIGVVKLVAVLELFLSMESASCMPLMKSFGYRPVAI